MRCRAVACLALAIVAGLGCGGGESGPAKAPGPRLTARVEQSLDAALQQKVADSGVPGISAAIVYPDGRVWSGAAGEAVLKPKRPMTPETSLPFGSITKLATAAFALRLVERGRLRLDDPIERWYRAWKGDPDATVRDLLGHTAGVGEPSEAFWDGLLRKPSARVTPAEVIAATPKPGPRTTAAEYSNTGFVIAGEILARAAREPLTAAMRRELFSRPGGDGLAIQPDEHPHAPLAHGYWYPKGAEPVDVSKGESLLPSRLWATVAASAGSLAGDVPSLARWGHDLFTGRILQLDSMRQMTRFHDGGHWLAYGLGLAKDSVEGRDLWGHEGDILGAHAELWHLARERVTIAIAWNDDLIDRDGGMLPALLRAAIGASRSHDGVRLSPPAVASLSTGRITRAR